MQCLEGDLHCQCILSIFPASMHQFYAKILVFVYIIPFLYISDQFALYLENGFFNRTLFHPNMSDFSCTITKISMWLCYRDFGPGARHNCIEFSLKLNSRFWYKHLSIFHSFEQQLLVTNLLTPFFLVHCVRFC